DPEVFGDASLLSLAGKDATLRALSEEEGIVRSVTRQGDEALVTFERVTHQVPVENCRDSGRIARIVRTSEGARVQYEQTCTSAGCKAQAINMDPVLIPQGMASGIKPGTLLEIRYDGERVMLSSGRFTDNGGRPWQAAPWAVYDGANRKRLLAFVGIAL